MKADPLIETLEGEGRSYPSGGTLWYNQHTDQIFEAIECDYEYDSDPNIISCLCGSEIVEMDIVDIMTNDVFLGELPDVKDPSFGFSMEDIQRCHPLLTGKGIQALIKKKIVGNKNIQFDYKIPKGQVEIIATFWNEPYTITDDEIDEKLKNYRLIELSEQKNCREFLPIKGDKDE